TCLVLCALRTRAATRRGDCCVSCFVFFFFSSRRRHTRLVSDWSSDVCSSDLFDPRVEKTLYYLSTDLSNSGVKASGFLKFCETLAPGNSLIKSASYLLHSGNFTTVRKFILANSATIIQDDSGVPLAYYNQKKWRFFP